MKRNKNNISSLACVVLAASACVLGLMFLRGLSDYFSMASNETLSQSVSSEEYEKADIRGNNSEPRGPIDTVSKAVERPEPSQFAETEQNAAVYRTSNGPKFSDAEWRLYVIVSDFAEKVGNGYIQQTVLDVPMEDIGLATKYTAEDLGVESLVSNGALAPGVTDIITEREPLRISLVISQIGLDHPDTMFWYDKSSKKNSADSIMVSEYQEDHYVCYQKLLKLQFAVLPEYAEQENVVSQSAIQCANKAKENGLKLVRQCSELSDMDKLNEYKKAICDLASYDEAVVEDKKQGMSYYGSQWQFTSVFDEDPNTRSVCEGYAKAFQYLCDNTEWNDTTVQCETVIGEISCSSEGWSGAAHMWNEVAINGTKYLADLTNSDTETVGSNGELFLAKSVDGNESSGYLYFTGTDSVLYKAQTPDNESQQIPVLYRPVRADSSQPYGMPHSWVIHRLATTTHIYDTEKFVAYYGFCFTSSELKQMASAV